MTDARVWCDNCGWEKQFSEGALRPSTDLEHSAKKRRAGHVAGAGCPHDATDFEVER